MRQIIYNYKAHSSIALTLVIIILPDGLAVDWVTNNVYFTDEVEDIIGVLDPDNSRYAVLIRTGPNTSPRAIVLDPQAR